MNRREFLITIAAGTVAVMLKGEGAGREAGPASTGKQSNMTRVSLIRTRDRAAGIRRAVDLLGINPVKGNDVLLKPNFNTADPYPASTHNDTLTHLVLHLRTLGAKSITIGERSGPPDTREVLKQKGIYDLCRKLDVGLINFEELPHVPLIRDAHGELERHGEAPSVAVGLETAGRNDAR